MEGNQFCTPKVKKKADIPKNCKKRQKYSAKSRLGQKIFHVLAVFGVFMTFLC